MLIALFILVCQLFLKHLFLTLTLIEFLTTNKFTNTYNIAIYISLNLFPGLQNFDTTWFIIIHCTNRLIYMCFFSLFSNWFGVLKIIIIIKSNEYKTKWNLFGACNIQTYWRFFGGKLLIKSQFSVIGFRHFLRKVIHDGKMNAQTHTSMFHFFL